MHVESALALEVHLDEVGNPKAEGTKNEKSLGLDRDVAREELDRAETYQLTDEGLFSRHQIIESQLDRELFASRADVAGRKLDASGKLSSAERALGEIDAGKARLKGEFAEKGLRSLRIAAPHGDLLVLERNWRGETPFVGDTLWPGQKIAELPDLSQLEAKVFVLEADGAGLKAGLEARLPPHCRRPGLDRRSIRHSSREHQGPPRQRRLNNGRARQPHEVVDQTRSAARPSALFDRGRLQRHRAGRRAEGRQAGNPRADDDSSARPPDLSVRDPRHAQSRDDGLFSRTAPDGRRVYLRPSDADRAD